MAERANGDAAAKENGPEEKSVDLICPINYRNTMSIRPFDLKLLPIQYDKKRFVQFRETTTEKKLNFDYFKDLKLNIDLVDIEKYSTKFNTPMHYDDEILLSEENFDLKGTESDVMLTNDVSTENIQFQSQTIKKVNVKAGFNIKNNLQKRNMIIDRESQLKAIEITFEASKKIPKKHPSKPNVYAVKTLEVFPDFKNWKYPCAHVIFDSNPAPVYKSKPAQLEIMSQAMLRGFMDEHNDHVVGYFLPSEETMCKRLEDDAENRHYDDNYQYKYKMAKKYDWNTKSKCDIDYEENYFLTIGPNGVFYNEFETTIHLKKKISKFAAESSNNNIKLNIQHVPSNEEELRTYKMREECLHLCDKEKELNFAEDAKTFRHNKNAANGYTSGNSESSSDLESCVFSKSIISSNDNGSIYEEDFEY